MSLHCLKDVMQFLRDNPEISDFVPEYVKFIRVLLTIPTSTCSNEKSFSYLRYLKSYLRSIMKRKSYCDYIYREMVDKLNVEEDH